MAPKNDTIVNAADCTVLHLTCKNDTNGNPRRLYLLVHPIHGYVAAVDEGYTGGHSIKRELGEAVYAVFRARDGGVVTGNLDTTPACRRELLKFYGPDGDHRKGVRA